MKRFIGVLLVVSLLAATLPVEAQESNPRPEQSTPTTLYFHINGFQDFPINTQKPDDRYADSTSVGIGTSSSSCVPKQEGAALVSQEFHTWYGYISPSYVEYDVQENGKPRIHQERGISYDARLDTSQDFELYWYVESQAASGDVNPDPNTVPVVIPNVKARATMRSGDAISVGDEAFNDGDLIAQGEIGPYQLAGPATEGANSGMTEVTYIPLPNNRHLYEFKIPMSISGAGRITRDDGANVRIDVWIDNPQCNDPDTTGYLMPNAVRVHTSSEYRPRMDLSIMNPISIDVLHPQFVGDDLVIHSSMNSPWGNYDVDENGGITLTVEGPSPATSLVQAAIVQKFHEHFHHQEPVDITYVWPYKQDGAKDGDYRVFLEVWNDQRTAKATEVAQFQIGKGTLPPCPPDADPNTARDCAFVAQESGGKDSPGLGLVGLLGLLGAALIVLRRRR